MTIHLWLIVSLFLCVGPSPHLVLLPALHATVKQDGGMDVFEMQILLSGAAHGVVTGVGAAAKA